MQPSDITRQTHAWYQRTAGTFGAPLTPANGC
jgi:hypothetical protein